MKDLEIIPLEGDERLIQRLIGIAKMSKCKRSKCGAMVTNHSMGFTGNGMVGEGWNSQPCDIDAPCFKDSLPANFKSDRTCCVHAEVRAINNSRGLCKGGILYFMRLNANEEPEDCGEPYCTICSKAALDAGIKRFVLYHSDGWRSYDANYYNTLSFQYKP